MVIMEGEWKEIKATSGSSDSQKTSSDSTHIEDHVRDPLAAE